MSFPARRVRTARASSRGTFQPTIQDFNDQLIDDDVLYIDSISRSHSECSFFTRSQSPFKFKRSIVKYSDEGTTVRHPMPAPFNSPRDSMATADELHRRHVLKSARLRSKLSCRKQGRQLDLKASGLTDGCQEAHPQGFAPTRPGSVQGKENPRMTPDRQNEPSVQCQPVRARPSTTLGRYFDSSNGLRTSRSFTSQRLLLRPHTASGWNQCGLSIQKMTLLPKDAE